METSNLSEKEFRVTIMKMIQDLGKRMEAKIEEMQEMLTKDLQELKNKLKWIIHQKESIAGFMGSQRVGHDWATELNWTEAEERINDLEDTMVKITATEQNTEKRIKEMNTT